MAWKTTIPWFGAVATLTAGYVWTRWSRGRRSGSPQASQTATLKFPPDEIPALPFSKLELDLDAMAEDDAQRAMEPERSFLEPELDIDWDDPEIELDAASPTAEVTEHLRATDEPYDAVDAEDIGSAWLRRATQSEPVEIADPEGTWEGATINEPRRHALEVLDELERREAAYGVDREGQPLAPYAGTHDEDVAAELPVGTLDPNGNAELHVPVNPPDGLGAPPTGTLATTDEEIARRARTAEATRRTPR